MTEEYIILVDEDKKILGTAPKLACHNAKTPLHLAFSIFLFNTKGELLLQQRSSKKKTWPLIWSNSCCGHQKLHERVKDTAKERLGFEMGITEEELFVALPNFRYRCEMNGIWENEICPVFVGVTSQEPIINTDEVETYQWISWDTWVKEITQNPQKYSYWSVEETKELLQNKTFQDFFHNAIK